jgi:hypothetical protein
LCTTFRDLGVYGFTSPTVTESCRCLVRFRAPSLDYYVDVTDDYWSEYDLGI